MRSAIVAAAAVLCACGASPDVSKINAAARIKLQRQLNSNYGVGRATARTVELVEVSAPKYEGSATVLVDGTNVILPLTVASDGKTAVLTSDDTRVGEVIAQHAAKVAQAIARRPEASTSQTEVPPPQPQQVRRPDDGEDYCGRPAVRRQVRSLDGGYVYLQVCRWVTSDLIVQVRVADGRRREVGPGNSLAVIRNGPYRGYLLLSRHKYLPGGGSYDPTFVVRPDGYEVLRVPGSEDDDDAVDAWLERNGWTAS